MLVKVEAAMLIMQTFIKGILLNELRIDTHLKPWNWFYHLVQCTLRTKQGNIREVYFEFFNILRVFLCFNRLCFPTVKICVDALECWVLWAISTLKHSVQLKVSRSPFHSFGRVFIFNYIWQQIAIRHLPSPIFGVISKLVFFFLIVVFLQVSFIVTFITFLTFITFIILILILKGFC